MCITYLIVLGLKNQEIVCSNSLCLIMSNVAIPSAGGSGSNPQRKRKRSIPWTRGELLQLSELADIYKDNWNEIFRLGTFQEGRTEAEIRQRCAKLKRIQTPNMKSKYSKERREHLVELEKRVQYLEEKLAPLERKAAILEEIKDKVRTISKQLEGGALSKYLISGRDGSHGELKSRTIFHTLVAICPSNQLDIRSLSEEFGIPSKYLETGGKRSNPFCKLRKEEEDILKAGKEIENEGTKHTLSAKNAAPEPKTKAVI